MAKYLPTCPSCGYVVSEGQKVRRCPGCGWDGRFGTTYVKDKADFDLPTTPGTVPQASPIVPPHTAEDQSGEADNGGGEGRDVTGGGGLGG